MSCRASRHKDEAVESALTVRKRPAVVAARSVQEVEDGSAEPKEPPAMVISLTVSQVDALHAFDPDGGVQAVYIYMCGLAQTL